MIMSLIISGQRDFVVLTNYLCLLNQSQVHSLKIIGLLRLASLNMVKDSYFFVVICPMKTG